MNTTITRTREAFLGDAEEGSTVRFSVVRTSTDDGQTHVVYSDGHPVFDDVHGAITTYRRVDQLPHAYIKFTVAGGDRVYKNRADFHIEIEEQMSVCEALSRVTEAAHRYRAGTIDDDEAGTALFEAVALLKAIELRAYPMGGHPDETAEQVVVTIHGVNLSIRGREHDLFVHVDDERDLEEKRPYPLCVEVNDCGENDYATNED